VGKTNIEWTDRSWNPIVGCSRVSEGCRHCYAERLAGTRLKHTARYRGLTKSGPDGALWTGETRFISEEFDAPQQWRKPQRIFVCDMGDLFHESVPDAKISLVLQMPLRGAHRHTYQILTKRIKRACGFFTYFWDHCYKDDGGWIPIRPQTNVWIGVSVENQDTADERIPVLLQTPAAVRFVSYEPALGPIDFSKWSPPVCPVHHVRTCCNRKPALHQIIFGGESGPGRRPVDLAWARATRDHCAETGTAFFMKQVDKIQPIPDDLMIREFPRPERGQAPGEPEGGH
jgi:protein gp37